MDPRQMKDPSSGVPAQLLAHLHLVSNHKYPLMGTPSLEAIVHDLINAPKVLREVATVHWTFIDAPSDGTVLLTWQPASYGENTFASDGYVWNDVEQAYTSDVRGYTLQMMMHRAGYKPQAENMATHCRRRYRLLPSNQTQMTGMPPPDPSLWLVHYAKAQPRDQHPVSTTTMAPQVAQQLQQRQLLQRSGQLPRKEFMFHDRAQWPVINLPNNPVRSGSSGQMVNTHRRAQSTAQNEVSVEEEEDVSRGDSLDFVSPRELSRVRYEQHHEWMEELLESPYATKQIIPSELGLGRKGPLEALTNGFFVAPTSVTQDPVNGQVGKLPPGKSAEFTRHANAKLAEMQAELEKMKEDHLRRMEKLRRTTDLGAAERKLRNMSVADDAYKIVAAQVQDLVGRQIEPVLKIRVAAKGGMIDMRPNAPERPAVSAALNQQQSIAHNQQMQQAQSRYQMSTTSKAQMPSQSASSNVQPSNTANAPTTTASATTETKAASPAQTAQGEVDASPDHVQSSTGPSEPQSESAHSQSELPNPDTDAQVVVEQKDDLDMTDAVKEQSDQKEEEQKDATSNHDGDDDIGDWDMLNEDALEPEAETIAEQNLSGDHQKSPAKSAQNEAKMQPERSVQPASTGGDNTPRGEFDVVTDFDTNMDTAGDALADYNVDDDLLNDSAFGDAFHHNEQDMS